MELPTPVTLIAQILLALSMALTFWRIVKGPSVADRITALDLFAALVMVQCALLVIKSGFIHFLDISTAIAIITFIATVALSKHLEKHSS